MSPGIAAEAIWRIPGMRFGADGRRPAAPAITALPG